MSEEAAEASTAPRSVSDTMCAAPKVPVAPRAFAGVRPRAVGAHPASLHADADSLLSDADSLGSGVDSLGFGTDSLFFAASADTLPADMPAFRTVTPKEIFGSASIGVVPVPTLRREALLPLTGNPWFEGFVLALAAVYAMLLCRHMPDVRLLLDRVFHDRASGERLAEEPGSNNLSRFLNIASAIGLLFVGVAAAKCADTLLPHAIPALPLFATAGIVLVFALLWVAVVAFQSALLHAAGAVTLSRPFIQQLWLLKRTYFALAVIVSTPPVLLFALCPPGSGRAWFWLAGVGSAVTALLYLRESRHLFLAKKIPFLHWFLYLCVVEIFPFSLLTLIAVR